MKSIDVESLEELREGLEEFLLLDVLSMTSFRQEHIPGAVNFPIDGGDFVQRVQERVGAKEFKIVVYCGSADCDAAERAAMALEKAGFTNVHAFDGGLEEWKDAGKSVGSYGAVHAARR